MKFQLADVTTITWMASVHMSTVSNVEEARRKNQRQHVPVIC